MSVAIKAIEDRRAERERLIGLARTYIEGLEGRVELHAAAVAGSVARGDFNVWSDVDVVVVAGGLPTRAPERAALLLEGAPPGLQPIGFSPEELTRAWDKGNRLVREAVEAGVYLRGRKFFSSCAGAGRRN
jgi:hypothetical protein